MKRNYFLKSFALVALMIFTVIGNAKEIPVADGATDTQLAAALEQAETGDVILMNGWVTLNAPVEITKNVTFKAGVKSAGFEGGGGRLFEMVPEVIDGAKLVFDNLGFVDGDAWGTETDGDGGVARISGGGTVEFILCFFENNVARRGGAFFITADEEAQQYTTVAFKGCEAIGNIAYGGGGESRGGYLFTDGPTHITHTYCQISSNQSIGGRGGALCIFGSGTHYYYYTVISDNKGGNWSDDETQKLDKDGNVVSDGEYEGGVAFIDGSPAITFEACGLVGNKSWSHGGLIRGFGSHNATFINCTLARNKSMHDRSPLWIGGTATHTYVNTFVVDNIGQNMGNGAGFDFDGANVHLNIFNSVFARNVAGGDGAVDIRNASNYATQLTVKNSLIGLIQGNSSAVTPQDNANIPTKSNVNMYKLSATEEASLEYASFDDVSGIDFAEGLKYSKPFGMPYYLLTASSTVTKLGDPALLFGEYDIDRDLFDQNRTTAADGSISAAPTIASTIEDYNDAGWEDKLVTGISKPSASFGGESIRIIGASNGILGIDFGTLYGVAKGTLISLTGQEVENVFNINVVGKGYYNINVAPGMYILKVEIGGKTYAQKLFVTN